MLIGTGVFGQQLKERLILSDGPDSLFLKAEVKSLDREGNYCFQVKREDSSWFYTGNDTLGPFKYIGSVFTSGGSMAFTRPFRSPGDKPWYYKNYDGSRVFGPVTGTNKRFMTGNTRQNLAVTITNNDSAYYYINGKLISKTPLNEANKFEVENADWCSFSENGNVIYYTKQDDLYYLYVNGKQVDTSYARYYELRINNKGQYICGEGRKPKQKVGKYDFMFFTHANDVVLGPVRTVWNCDLKENGAYFYSGDDNGTDYIVINDHLHKNLDSITNITLLDRKNSLFYCKEYETPKINVNGNFYALPFREIYYPSLDQQGNFAFFGIQDYYLYKYVNGTLHPEPITKYGVRPVPLYISPEGSTLVYYRTEDSTYIYRDEHLLFPPIANTSHFLIKDYNDVLPHDYTKRKSGNGSSLFYLELDSIGYFVYNGVFSKAMIKAYPQSYFRHKLLGEIVAGQFNDHGFYFIQKTGENKFLININNTFYQEIDGIEQILLKNFYFDEKSLVFYGIKDRSFYQYTFNL